MIYGYLYRIILLIRLPVSGKEDNMFHREKWYYIGISSIWDDDVCYMPIIKYCN